jgi:hypothetical protein
LSKSGAQLVRERQLQLHWTWHAVLRSVKGRLTAAAPAA